MSNLDTLLVELGTEELPPKALKKLGISFSDGILQGLKDANLQFKSHRWHQLMYMEKIPTLPKRRMS